MTDSLQGLAIFLCHVIFNDKVKGKLCSYLQRKFEVIHEDALSRADTTKKTVIIIQHIIFQTVQYCCR